MEASTNDDDDEAEGALAFTKAEVHQWDEMYEDIPLKARGPLSL